MDDHRDPITNTRHRRRRAFAAHCVISPKGSGDLAISMDTLVGGVHFPPDALPADIAYKALAVNLSDMAAMGAMPEWAVMRSTVPREDADWLAAFSEGWKGLAEEYEVRTPLWDIHRGSVAVTVQIHGWVPEGHALRRQGARAGDGIFVTGTLGDAGLALAARAGRCRLGERERHFAERRLARPTPRVSIGRALLPIASAAIDLSDGLGGDLAHIAKASRLGATLLAEDIPLSPPLRAGIERSLALELALSSGDDYDLCFTVPPENHARLMAAAKGFPCPIRRIGVMEEAPGIRLLAANGQEITPTKGYRHFG